MGLEDTINAMGNVDVLSGASGAIKTLGNVFIPGLATEGIISNISNKVIGAYVASGVIFAQVGAYCFEGYELVKNIAS